MQDGSDGGPSGCGALGQAIAGFGVLFLGIELLREGFTGRGPQTLPPLAADQVILEVKFNQLLPQYLKDVIALAAGWSSRSAISKYVLCRRFEGKEF